MPKCEPIKMADGSIVLAMVKSGKVLNDDELKAIAEYVQFCRDRRERKNQQKHNWGYRKGITWEMCLTCGVLLHKNGSNKDANCKGITKLRRVEKSL